MDGCDNFSSNFQPGNEQNHWIMGIENYIQCIYIYLYYIYMYIRYTHHLRQVIWALERLHSCQVMPRCIYETEFYHPPIDTSDMKMCISYRYIKKNTSFLWKPLRNQLSFNFIRWMCQYQSNIKACNQTRHDGAVPHLFGEETHLLGKILCKAQGSITSWNNGHFPCDAHKGDTGDTWYLLLVYLWNCCHIEPSVFYPQSHDCWVNSHYWWE